MHRHVGCSLLSLLAALALPAVADPSPSSLQPDILYTAKGEFVQVNPMRPLTLNAHAMQFAYEPLGIEVAFVGQEAQGENTIYFVKVLDARTGREMERLTQAVTLTPEGDEGGGFRLLGWSASGKYLMLQRYAVDGSGELGQCLRWDVSHGAAETEVISPETLLPPEARLASADAVASPSGRWVLFTQFYTVPGLEGGTLTSLSLYDPEKNTLRPLTSLGGEIVAGWIDDDHVRLIGKPLPVFHRPTYQVSTGTIADAPAHAPDDLPALPTSTQYPDLTLDVEKRLLKDATSDGRINAHILWLRRTPPGKLPLGVEAAGLTSGDDDPQAVWSPNGKQIAFLAHGDLCVTDLTAATNLIPREKMAVGLTLTCSEEQQLALSDLKQIGLGIIQYTQDYDEKYPTADGFVDKIYPYLKTRDVFQIGSHRFIYEQPADLSLAKMESPATTELGYVDLPCARIVLLADGHVKSFPKGQETGQ